MAGPAGRVDAVVICGGQWHDFDYARRELLAGLGRWDNVRTRVFEDFSTTSALERADVLVTYTCNVRPTEDEAQAIADWVGRGGRWIVLHGTTSAIDPLGRTENPKFRTPRVFDTFARLAGNQFIAHPPIEPYTVKVTAPEHPLVTGIDSFEVRDELYVLEMHPPVEVLLHTEFDGISPGFEESGPPTDIIRPVLYLKPTGDGNVCFFGLGHCRGRFDVQDLGVDDLGKYDFGSWQNPEFRTVLDRVLHWGVTGTFDHVEASTS